MDRGAWQAAIRGVAESDMTERLTLSLFNIENILLLNFFLFSFPCLPSVIFPLTKI